MNSLPTFKQKRPQDQLSQLPIPIEHQAFYLPIHYKHKVDYINLQWMCRVY